MNILIIVSFVISLISLCVSIYSVRWSIRTRNSIIHAEGISPNEKPKSGSVEYMHSLEFNTYLDGKIQPLLGEYNNEEIITTVYLDALKDIYLYDIDKTMLKNYIADVLSNYHNPYIESTGKISAIEDYFEPVEQIDIKSIEKINTTNIDSVLNDFYR